MGEVCAGATPKVAPRTQEKVWAPSRERLIRSGVILVSLGCAVAGAFSFDPHQVPLYATYLIVALPTYFLWVDVPPPGLIALPFLAVLGTFVYLGGLPIVTLAYVLRYVVLPMQVLVYGRRWLRPPRYLLPKIDPLARGALPPLDVLIDHAADFAACTLSLLVGRLALGPLNAALGAGDSVFHVLVAAVVSLAFCTLACAVLPLPTSRWLLGKFPGWSNFVQREHIEILAAVFVLTPVCGLAVYYGYRSHGTWGACAGLLVTLVPHWLLQLLNDRRERTDQLMAANRALHDKQTELQTFVYALTHDLKNPIGAIEVSALLTQESDQATLSDDGREHVERIERLARTTHHMINDLLELFRITSLKEEEAAVDLQPLIEQVLDTLRPQFTSKGLCVVVETLPAVRGQTTKLRHAVANLLSNAVKYSPPQTGQITVSAATCEDRVQLCVQDNGCGIPRAYLSEVFELFVRVPPRDGESAPQGTGVGLAIVKRIIEAHAGRVWVESELGCGSRFMVELPAA